MIASNPVINESTVCRTGSARTHTFLKQTLKIEGFSFMYTHVQRHNHKKKADKNTQSSTCTLSYADQNAPANICRHPVILLLTQY